MHAVSTNQIADILNFNDNGNYQITHQRERHIIMSKYSILFCLMSEIIHPR